MKALTDGAGNAFYDQASGRMLVLPDVYQLTATFAGNGGFLASLFLSSTILTASFPGAGRFYADLEVKLGPGPEWKQGKYVPVNAFLRRTTIYKRR